MTKKIYWIDDDISDMMNLIKNFFPVLWKKNYNSQIFFAGNNYREADYSLRDEITLEELNNTTSKVFEIFCASQVDKNNEHSNNPKKVREKLNNMGINVYPSEDIEKDGDKIVDELEKNIVEKLKDGFYIGIDIQLLNTDKNQLANIENNKETLAMKLFNSLSMEEEKNRTIFLYTSFYTPNLQEKWEKAFKNFHSTYDKKIKIFSRRKLIDSDDDNKEEQNTLLKLLDSEGNI